MNAESLDHARTQHAVNGSAGEFPASAGEWHEVTLTPAEMLSAAHVGIMRHVQNLKRDKAPMYGASGMDDWQLHIEGALGECAVSKLLNLYWLGSVGNLMAADVGRLQVRTRSKHNYDLILHPADLDNAAYILVTGINGRYRVHGWIYGREGKLPEFWKDPTGTGRPAYFVPRSLLTPDIAAALFV
jgi:hypothetical protein